MKIKRLSTFQEYLKEQKQMNENVNIECEFWDECIAEVLSDLEDECNGCFDWTVLGDFIKAKFSILGREWDEYIDNIYVLHIKDLIWAHHSNSFCDGTYTDNAALHSKGVVVEQLAATIYDKLCEKLGDSTSTNTKIKVADIQPAPEPDDICDDLDDLPFEKNVKTYKEYTKLNETIQQAIKENLDVCTQYCIERIEKEVGSLDPDRIIDTVVKKASPQIKGRIILLYIVPLVQDFLSSNSLVIADDSPASQEMVRQAIEDISYKMAEDVLFALYKINGDVDEEAE